MIYFNTQEVSRLIKIQNCLTQLRKIISASTTASEAIASKSHRTVFHELLSSDVLPPHEKSESSLRDNVQIVIGAGVETTAHTLKVITYHLYTNPTLLQNLRAELRTVQHPGSSVKLAQLEKLRYLTAVILEGLRLSYGVTARFIRIAPDHTITYSPSSYSPSSKTWSIPPGTPVGMSTLLTHHNESIFPDSHTFKPERWLEDAERRRLDRYLVSFSKGTRNCLGMNLAWAELYLCLAAVVARFEFEMAEGTGLEDVEVSSDQFVPAMRGAGRLDVFVKRVGV